MTISKKNILNKSPQTKVSIKTHERQLLENLEKQLTLNLDSFLVLSEEGDPTQIALAYQKAKNEFLKLGPEMHRLAEHIGVDLTLIVDDFLESIDVVLHRQGMLDEDKIARCINMAARLQAELKKPF